MPGLGRDHYVVAADMKGYGGTRSLSQPEIAYGATGSTTADTMSEFHNLTRKLLSERPASAPPVVKCVIGHDMGANIAASLAQLRPDLYKALIVMSHPFSGAADPLDTADTKAKKAALAGFADLDPPRKHYQWHFSEPTTAQELMDAPQGLRAFYRGYYWFKSALCPQNTPHTLSDSWSAEAMAALPHYYVMPRDATMPEAVGANVPAYEEMVRQMAWMTEDEIEVYLSAFLEGGFQGGLNQYIARTSGIDARQSDWQVGLRVGVPMAFISGERDWGNYQSPGSIPAMGQVATDGNWRGAHFIPDAGHWCQQEQPERVLAVMQRFFGTL